MRQILIRILVTTLLVLSLILLVVFNIGYFIGGPIVLDKVTDQNIMQNMSRKNSKSNCELISRFADDDIYYVAKCNDDYIFYNDDATVLAVRAVNTLNITTATEMYEAFYDLSDAEIKLGYYDEHPIYVFSNEKLELLINIDNLEVLRYYQKG